MTLWRRDCACGSVVTADPIDPFPGVAQHVGSNPHRAWSLRTSWSPQPTVLDSTAEPERVDLSAFSSVRPVLRRRPGVRSRRYIPGRKIA